MEDKKIISISELLQRSRPLTAALSLSVSSASRAEHLHSATRSSKKRKFAASRIVFPPHPVNCLQQSTEKSCPRIISSLKYGALLIGSIYLPGSNSQSRLCWKDGCLVFSDGVSSVCCAVIPLDAKIINSKIRVLAWNFIPFKCSGGLLEIINWDLLEPADGTRCRNYPLLSLSYPPQSKQHRRIHGKLVSVSPLVRVPCIVHAHKPEAAVTNGFNDGENMRGFLAEVVPCNCDLSCSGSKPEHKHHPSEKPMIVFFYGPTSSWHPVILNLLCSFVSIACLKKKLISTGKATSYEVLITTEESFIYLSHMHQEIMPISRTPIRGMGEMGEYMGAVTGLYMQGMIIELDNKVWLCLTDHLLCPPHSLRVGAIVSLINIHFVRPKFSWVRMLLLGVCFRTTISVKSFSPLESPCYFRKQKQSLLGKLIESLTYSARFWLLLTISCLRQKFAGVFSEHDILGSKHREGFAQMYANSRLPLCAYRPKHQEFIEFCNHNLCNCGRESDLMPLKLVVPISNFISHCQSRWISTLLQAHTNSVETPFENVGDAVSSESVPCSTFIRQFISSKDLGTVLMGTLQLVSCIQISSTSGRLELADATGRTDVIIPDLLSSSSLNKIYEVRDYHLILEGLPMQVHSERTVDTDNFSCRSILNHVQPHKRIDKLVFYIHFYLKDAICHNPAFCHPDMNLNDYFKKRRGSRFHVLFVIHKFFHARAFQDNPVTEHMPSLFMEAIRLPYDLYLHHLDIDNQQIQDTESRGGALVGIKHILSSIQMWSKLHSTAEIPCFLSLRSSNTCAELTHCVLSPSFSTSTARKILLEFKFNMIEQYEAMKIGALYIIEHENEEIMDVNFYKIIISPQKPLWSLTFSSVEAIHQIDRPKHQSFEIFVCKEILLVNLLQKEVLFKLSTSDVHLYLPPEGVHILKFPSDTLGCMSVIPRATLVEPVSVNTCIHTMVTASVQSCATSSLNFHLPTGHLISFYGSIVYIHSLSVPGTFCIHVCEGSSMVKICCSLDACAYPVGIGPGADATFYRVLVLGSHDLMLIPASFIVINSIKEVNCYNGSHSLLVPCGDALDEFSMVPLGLILQLSENTKNQIFQFFCRVVNVQFLLLAKRSHKYQMALSVEQSKVPDVNIPLAGFVLDDGSSFCCCWADASRAAELLKLNEIKNRIYNDGWLNMTLKDGEKTTVGHYLKMMLTKHERVKVMKCSDVRDPAALEYDFIVDSNEKLASLDENILKFIILNASCGPLLNIVCVRLDSTIFEQLSHITSIGNFPQSMHVWAKEVRYRDSLHEARNTLQEMKPEIYSS